MYTNLIDLVLFSIFKNFTSSKTSQECQTSKISMKFATKFEIQKGLKYEIYMKFNGNLKFANEI